MDVEVSDSNIEKEFGLTAKDFRRVDFENWVASYSADKPSFRTGFGWYSPSIWRKSWYIMMGGFDLSKSFPHHVDRDFKERCEETGQRFIVANSYAYHFQRAGENLGEKPERQ